MENKTKSEDLVFTDRLSSKVGVFLGNKIGVSMCVVYDEKTIIKTSLLGILEEHPDPEYTGHYRVVSLTDPDTCVYFNGHDIKSVTIYGDYKKVMDYAMATFEVVIDTSIKF